ncbi:hypothetical protein GCM10023238_01440 [Streptomyces heliomycini]
MRGRTVGVPRVGALRPVALWLAAGYAVATALALLATWYRAMGDRPHLGTPLGDAAVLVCAALTGQVVGRLVAWRPAAPLLAAAGYVVLGVRRTRPPGIRSIPVAPSSRPRPPRCRCGGSPGRRWRGRAGLAAAAVLAYTARRRAVALLPLVAAAAPPARCSSRPATVCGTPLRSPRRQVCDTPPPRRSA